MHYIKLKFQFGFCFNQFLLNFIIFLIYFYFGFSSLFFYLLYSLFKPSFLIYFNQYKQQLSVQNSTNISTLISKGSKYPGRVKYECRAYVQRHETQFQPLYSTRVVYTPYFIHHHRSQ